MALTRFGFIVTGDDFVQWTGTEHFRMKVVGVKSPEQGIQAARWRLGAAQVKRWWRSN